MIFPECDAKCVLLLGVGNYLMGDEGVGVHIAHGLSGQQLPPGVDVLDGGTGGFQLMGALEQYEVVVLIDATLDGRPAGSVRLLEPQFASDFPRSMSTHDVGLRDVLEALQLTGRMPKMYVVAISVESFQPMTVRLSPPVRQAAAHVQAEIRALLWDWWRERHIYTDDALPLSTSIT